MTATPYIYSEASVWDSVIDKSPSRPFMLRAAYMDYHRHRFQDASVLIHNQRGKVVGAFPANIIDNETVVSHSGLTYGGLIYAADTHATDVFEMLQSVCAFYQAKGCKQLIYKPIPYIYNAVPNEADLYWLTQHGASLHTRTLSSAIDLTQPLPYSELRRRGVAKAKHHQVVCVQSANFEIYWTLLDEVLMQRHHTHPVHTLHEIRHLSSLFPENILLHTASYEGRIVAGVVIYRTDSVAHAQYIAANEVGRNVGALDLLFTNLISHYQAVGCRYFDFGISTLHDGSELNNGLLAQKEGFGARTVCYDTYKLNL